MAKTRARRRARK